MNENLLCVLLLQLFQMNHVLNIYILSININMQKGLKQMSTDINSANLQTLNSNTKAQIYDVGPVSLPEGTEVKKNSYGYCYVATKLFKKGDIIYECEYVVAPHYVNEFKFSINGVQYFCDQNNSVRFEDERCLYTCGSFINHCCQQNCYTIQIDGKEVQVACKDIQPGEEINTNYFHYDYEGFNFKCLCKSPNCLGQINGFKNLSLENKLKVLPRALPCIKQYWLKDDNKVVIIQDLKIPYGFQMVQSQGGQKIHATTQFEKNSILFKFKRDYKFEKDLILVYKLGQNYERWSKEAEFNYFLSFLSVNADPNCKVSLQGDQYVGFALKDIKIGDYISVGQAV